MINYYCPGIEQSLEVYKILNFFKNKYPEIFYENVNIKYAFGTFSNMIWNGGCINIGEGKSLSEIQHICNEYDKLNINLQLTLTNPLIQEEHCYDTYCNSVLNLLKDRNYTILVSSPILEDYLRSKFKNNYKNTTKIIIASRISSIMHADKIIVLENGCISDIGTHADLASRDGLYASLWKIQGALEEEFLNLVEKEVK